jgi:Ca2+/H+ antiporter, TMEM165/GDT1 family
MNLEKVVFGFFILLALTVNFSFFVGEIDNPAHHHHYELYAALVISLITTVLKFGDRSQMGAILVASSLVADLQLIAAVVVWGTATASDGAINPDTMASIVSLSGGALVANTVSVILLVVETLLFRR